MSPLDSLAVRVRLIATHVPYTRHTPAPKRHVQKGKARGTKHNVSALGVLCPSTAPPHQNSIFMKTLIN